MKRSPDASTATSEGASSSAAVAGPPSPAKPATPLPASVVITPVERFDFPDPVVAVVGDEQVARGVHGHAVGRVQLPRRLPGHCPRGWRPRNRGDHAIRADRHRRGAAEQLGTVAAVGRRYVVRAGGQQGDRQGGGPRGDVCRAQLSALVHERHGAPGCQPVACRVNRHGGRDRYGLAVHGQRRRRGKSRCRYIPTQRSRSPARWCCSARRPWRRNRRCRNSWR